MYGQWDQSVSRPWEGREAALAIERRPAGQTAQSDARKSRSLP